MGRSSISTRGSKAALSRSTRSGKKSLHLKDANPKKKISKIAYKLDNSLSKITIGKKKKNYKHVYSSSFERFVSPIGQVTLNDAKSHVRSLEIETIARHMRPILNKLMYHSANPNFFNKPVDPIAEKVSLFY